MQAQDMTMADYAGILRRRWRPALLVGIVVAFLAIYVAYTLPAIYESSATILIEQQEIPEQFVQSTINSYTDERLQSIRQRVMATPQVAEIIEAFDLYPEERTRMSQDELVRMFRDSSAMQPINVTATHSRTGRLTDITYAFQISFQYPKPQMARDVVEELSQRWMAENEALRAQTTARTARFLDAEVVRVEAQLAELQARIAEFKERHGDSLPDARLLNLQTQERLGRELTDVENQLRATRERKALLEGELAETPRFRPVLSESGEPVLGGADRLAMLQQELITARGRYSENHPDVIRLRREIAALSDETGSQASLAQQLRASLESNRRQLDVALETFSPEHPDVLRLQRTVASLEAQLAELGPEAGAGSFSPTRAINPPYQQLQTRIRTADAELQDLSRRRGDLVARLNDIERRVGQSPQVEREFSALMREQESLMTEYRELRANQSQAGLAETLETGEKGERLRIIEPAFLPTSPIKPNRASMSFLGVLLAVALALGIVSLTESMDTSVRGRRDVSAILEMPPLAVIPFIETPADTRKRILGNVMMFVVAAVALGTLYGTVIGI
jgi:polysaccharide biosynthesis transport protein